MNPWFGGPWPEQPVGSHHPGDELWAAYEAANDRLHRAEWVRFLLACSMVLVMIAEACLLFVGSHLVDYAWVWLGIIAIQGYSLHLQTRTVILCRKIAFDLWQVWFDAARRF